MRQVGDDLEQSIKRADPMRGLVVDTNALDDLLRSATASSPPVRSRRAAVLIGAGIVGLVAVGVSATPAAADAVRHFLAQTGLFGDESSSETDATEYIDLLAPDAEQYILTLYPAYLPAAPGVDPEASRQEVAQQIVATARAESKADGESRHLAQKTGLERSFEERAYIDWIRTWIEADATGDTATRAAATRVLRAACSWPAFVSTDGGGVIARMKTFARAAETGDVDGVQAAAEYMSGDDRSVTGWDGEVRTWWLKGHQP